MGSLNKWIGIGNLGRDPELKSTGNGTTVCSFSIACTETWKDKGGQKQERTEWVRCVAWNNLAELCGQYLKKGRQTYVEGRLQTREYEGKDGTKKYSTEVVVDKVVFLGSGEGQGQGGGKHREERASGGKQTGWGEQQNGSASPLPEDDDVPF